MDNSSQAVVELGEFYAAVCLMAVKAVSYALCSSLPRTSRNSGWSRTGPKKRFRAAIAIKRQNIDRHFHSNSLINDEVAVLVPNLYSIVLRSRDSYGNAGACKNLSQNSVLGRLLPNAGDIQYPSV